MLPRPFLVAHETELQLKNNSKFQNVVRWSYKEGIRIFTFVYFEKDRHLFRVPGTRAGRNG